MRIQIWKVTTNWNTRLRIWGGGSTYFARDFFNTHHSEYCGYTISIQNINGWIGTNP